MSSFSEYQQFLGSFGDRSWLILFVEADLEHATRALIDVTEFEDSKKTSIVSASPGVVERRCFAFETERSRWTVIQRFTGSYADVPFTELSARLQCRLVVYQAEDCSGLEEIMVYSQGELQATYRTAGMQKHADEIADECESYAQEFGIELVNNPTIPASEIVTEYGTVMSHLLLPLIRCVYSAAQIHIEPSDHHLVVRAVVLE